MNGDLYTAISPKGVLIHWHCIYQYVVCWVSEEKEVEQNCLLVNPRWDWLAIHWINTIYPQKRHYFYLISWQASYPCSASSGHQQTCKEGCSPSPHRCAFGHRECKPSFWAWECASTLKRSITISHTTKTIKSNQESQVTTTWDKNSFTRTSPNNTTNWTPLFTQLTRKYWRARHKRWQWH